MNYLSLSFACAVLFAFCISIFIPNRFRWILLLGFSCWALLNLNGALFFLAVAQALWAYAAGLLIGRTASVPRGRGFIWGTAIAVEFFPLVFFKYLSPFIEVPFLKSWQGILVPLGLSFYTFQIVAYLTDVYRGRLVAETHPGYFSLYVLFFANKPAGPIEDPSMIRRLSRLPFPSALALRESFFLIGLGLIKKLLLADNLAPYVDPIFQRAEAFAGLPVLVAVLLAKYQIYCDFSGATDIALGTAGLFGVGLSPNFDRPFAARSMREFWRRWHMTLQTWIRDYVFYPLLGSRLSRFGLLPLLLISFFIFGLWHGPRWTFVLYGLLQGLFVYVSSKRKIETRQASSGWRRFLSFVFFYAALISLPNILFRADSLSQAGSVFMSIGLSTTAWEGYPSLGNLTLPWILLLIAALEIWQWAEVRKNARGWLLNRPFWFRLTVGIVVAIALILFVDMGKGSPFIYSKF